MWLVRVKLSVNVCKDAGLPGVLLGVFDEFSDTLVDFPGDRPPRADALDELTFLCHRATGAFVMGKSNRKMLWMSFSNPNCAILFRVSHDLMKDKANQRTSISSVAERTIANCAQHANNMEKYDCNKKKLHFYGCRRPYPYVDN